MKLFSALLIANIGFGHTLEADEVTTIGHAHEDATTTVVSNATEQLSHYQFSGFDHYDLDREQRAKKNQDKKPKQPSKKPVTSDDVHLPDPILGDEPEGRGQHRCGNVPIPPIVCVDGKCPPGFPRYDRPCNNPMELRGKFKCRVQCGPGWRVATGTPKKMKCLGKEGKPGYFKIRPKTFGHRIECVQKR